MTKRIDLTQFERILDGPWSLVDGSEVQTKGPRIWQYIIGADIGTGLDMRIAAVEQSIDEIMAWGEESNLHEQIANYHLPPKEEGIALATAKAVQMLPGLVAELKRMYAREDSLLDALRIIRDDLNEGMAQGHLPIESTHGVSARKIRNFANDASQ